MNLFNEYYKMVLDKMLLNEAPPADEKYRGKTARGSINTQSAGYNTPERIKKAKESFLKGKDKANFDEIKRLLGKGKINDAYKLAEGLKNDIRNLTTFKNKKDRDTMRGWLLGLIDATETPYHSFGQAIQYNKRDFIIFNNKKVEEDIKNRKLNPKFKKEIQENIPYWNDFYYEIGYLLTTYDMYDSPQTYHTTLNELNSMNLNELYDFAKSSDHFKKTYFKTMSLRDSSMHKSKSTVAEKEYDKVPVFFMTSAGPATKLLTIPFTLEEKKLYPTLKSKEDNIPLRRYNFEKGTNRLFGAKVGPPEGYTYTGGNRKVIPALGSPEEPLTMTQLKEKLGHDQAFKEFLKKYPIEDDIYLEQNTKGTLQFRPEYHRVRFEAARKGMTLKDRSFELAERNKKLLEKGRMQQQNTKVISPIEDDEEEDNF
jgi:hypothetical protein